MLVSMILAFGLALLAFPRSTARWQRDGFAAVAEWIARLKRTRILFWVVVLAAAMAFGAVFAPELAWLAAIDMATYLEVLAAAALAGATVRIGVVRRGLQAGVTRVFGRAHRRLSRLRRRRVVRQSKPRLPPRDIDGGAVFA